MPEGRRIVWSPAAKADLLDLWRYRSETASLDAADDILRSIQSAAARLDRLMTPGRPRDELIAGLRSVFATRTLFFFRLRNDRIEIVRVLYERRDLLTQFGTKQE